MKHWWFIITIQRLIWALKWQKCDTALPLAMVLWTSTWSCTVEQPTMRTTIGLNGINSVMQQHHSLWCGHWPPFARSHLAIFLGIRIIYLISNAIMTIANIRQCIWLLIEATCWLELVVLHTLHTDHLGYRWDFVTDTLDMCGGWYGISERFHSHCQRVSGGNLMQDVVLQNNGGEHLTRSAQRELLNLVEYARGERGLNEKGICRMFLCKHNRPCPTCICAKHCIISMFCGRPRLEVRLME